MTDSLWRHADFRKLWIGQTISELGSVVTRTAIGFVAILVLGAGPAELGILTAAASVGTLLVGLVAGVQTDRMRRRPILIVADLVRAALLLAIPLAYVAGWLRVELLYVVVFLAAMLGAFFDVAYRSYLPSLVGRDRIVEGNAKLGMSGALAEVVAPALAGAIVQLVSAVAAILVDAASFLVSAISILLIRKPEPPLVPRGERSAWSEVSEGLTTVFRDGRLRATTGFEVTRYFFGSFIGVLYVLYGLNDLGLSPFIVGVAISLGGVGAFIGAALVGPTVRRFGIGPTIVRVGIAGGILVFLLPLAKGQPPVIAASFLFIGQLLGDTLGMIEDVAIISLRQQVTRDELLGRVNATVHVLVDGVAPLGALVGAALAVAFGNRDTLLVAAVGVLFARAWLVFSPLGSLREADLTGSGSPSRSG
ncbi:MAG TPA: MFS transporter [Candidatus Bathyarchaeia archaeon]|nr:MFS transporter [Candidatus Bathyarchaeia archaeon]